MNENMRNAVLGVITGDALGCPVQFESREEIARHPVTGMRGYGTFNLPEGSWTDDSSLTIAALESIRRLGKVDVNDIMNNFCGWLYEGKFTPFGYSYDIGRGTRLSIDRYSHDRNPYTCGGTGERDNGNGSLMRIIPVCVFAAVSGMSEEEMIHTVDEAGGLTHNHPCAKTACGLYAFLVKALIEEDGSLNERLKKGMENGFAWYDSHPNDSLYRYGRLRNLESFRSLPATKISGSGYVVDSLEAAVWCLLNGNTFEETVLKAVNLGEDTDSVAAIAGGLAGLYYTADAIPRDWYHALQSRNVFEPLLEK